MGNLFIQPQKAGEKGSGTDADNLRKTTFFQRVETQDVEDPAAGGAASLHRGFPPPPRRGASGEVNIVSSPYCTPISAATPFNALITNWMCSFISTCISSIPL